MDGKVMSLIYVLHIASVFRGIGCTIHIDKISGQTKCSKKANVTLDVSLLCILCTYTLQNINNHTRTLHLKNIVMQYDVSKIDIMMSEVLILEPKSNNYEIYIAYPINSKLCRVLIHISLDKMTRK